MFLHRSRWQFGSLLHCSYVRRLCAGKFRAALKEASPRAVERLAGSLRIEDASSPVIEGVLVSR